MISSLLYWSERNSFIHLTYQNLYVSTFSVDLIVNIILLIAICAYALHFRLFSFLEFTLFLLSILLILLIHRIIPANYFPDQITYTNFVRDVRLGIASEPWKTTIFVGHIYSYLPLSTPNSIISFSLYNKFLLLLSFILLRYYGYLNFKTSIILLTYPSLILYSSIGLREMLVLSCMLVWLIGILNQKYIISLIVIVILYFIKTQNAFLLGAFTVLHVYYYIIFLNYKNFFIRIIFPIITILAGYYYFGELFYSFLNYKITTMHIDYSEIDLINGFYDFIRSLFLGFFHSLFFKSSISEKNILEIVQIFENFYIAFLLLYLIVYNYINNKNGLFLWILFLFITLSIHGVVVDNFGTLSRFKTPFIVLFIIAINYLKMDNRFSFKKNNV